MNHHVYVAAMLQLAFLPEGQPSADLVDVVLYPRGPDKEPLWAAMWERMIDQFKDTCDYMQMDDGVSQQGVNNLLRYKKMFRKGEIKLVGGMHTPHVLRRVVKAEFDVSAIEKTTGKKKKYSSSKSSTCTESVTSSDSSCSVVTKTSKRKGVWRRLLGWTKA